MRFSVGVWVVASSLPLSLAVSATGSHDRRQRSIRTHHENSDRSARQEVTVDAHGTVSFGAQLLRSSSDGGKDQLTSQPKERVIDLGIGPPPAVEVAIARRPALVEKELEEVFTGALAGHYPVIAFDPSETFSVMLKVNGADQDLTDQEVDTYRSNFVDYMHAMTKAARLHTLASSTGMHLWLKMSKVSMELAKPVQTAKLVADINALNGEWHAAVQESVHNLTWLEASMLAGVAERASAIDEVNGSVADILPQAAGNVSQFIGEVFDARQEWKQCASVFSKAKDQGQCGSSWAEAAASLAEARQCVAGTQDVSLSANYIISCSGGSSFDGRSSCDAGSPLDALTFLAEHGAPSGGRAEGSSGKVCLPVWGEGSAMKHAEVPLSSRPACPNECFDRNFQKSLKDDTTVTEGLSNMIITRDVEKGKLGIRTYGSVLVTFHVFRDFYSYKYGIYKPVSDELAGAHAAIAIGYGKDYILAVNSWSSEWGEGGAFKLSTDMKPVFYIPGRKGGPTIHAEEQHSGVHHHEGTTSTTPSGEEEHGGKDTSSEEHLHNAEKQKENESPGEWQCAWIKTSTCRRSGGFTTAMSSCDASISFGDKGFCDCNGNGKKDAAEPSYSCDATPGTCLEACGVLKRRTTKISHGEHNTAHTVNASGQIKAGRFLQKPPGTSCSFNRDIVEEPMCHAAAAELGLEWGGEVETPSDRKYCLYSGALGQVVFNKRGEHRNMPLPQSASICHLREPNFSYSLAGHGECEDTNGTAAQPTLLGVNSTPLTNCEVLCSGDPRCKGFTNHSSGCQVYEDTEIGGASGPSNASVLCFKKGIPECGSHWAKKQGPSINETEVESSCACEVACLLNGECTAWTYAVGTSTCTLHANLTDDGESCRDKGCLAGRIGARPHGREITAAASLAEKRVDTSIKAFAASGSSTYWKLLHGACTVDNDCIFSPGYPANYEDSQNCSFELIPSHVHVNGYSYIPKLEVQDFTTERLFDILTVNGQNYSGVVSPHGVAMNSRYVEWTSDSDITHRGFHICLNMNPAQSALKVNPPSWNSPEEIATVAEQKHLWAVLPEDDAAPDSQCTIDSNLCILSPGYENGVYPESSSCRIVIADGQTPRLQVMSFNTESYFDVLIVNGAHYSGQDSPDGVQASEMIVWSADDSLMAAGFKICPENYQQQDHQQESTGSHHNTGDARHIHTGHSLWSLLLLLALYY